MRAKGKLKPKKSGNQRAFLYVLPMLGLMVFFWSLPVLIAIVGSFTNYNGMNEWDFIGMANYQTVINDSLFYSSLRVTVMFVLFVVPGQTILSFLAAAWIDRCGGTRVSNFVRWTMFIPTLASTSVIGIVCRSLLNNADSPLNAFLGLFGVKGNMLLGSATGALGTLIVIEILMTTGYYMIIYLSAMASIPRSYYEAARMEGASVLSIYRRILLPMLRPTTIMIVFLGTLSSIQMFDLVYVMTGGGPQTATYTIMLYLYMNAFKYSKVALGMAISVVLCALVGFLVFLQRKTLTSRQGNLY